MSRRSRIFVGIVLVYAAAMAFLLYQAISGLDPRYRESAEESLVETAQLLASLVEQDLREPPGAPASPGTLAAPPTQIDPARLQALFEAGLARRFSAQIFGLSKTRVELRAYLTDARGRLLFDSTGQAPGADFSQWRDVRLALRGEYGARTTADHPQAPDSSVMYVAAPVRWRGDIIGAVSVGKPTQSFGPFVAKARANIILVGLFAAMGALLLALIVSVWLVRPFGLLADFARFARTQRPLSVARLWQRARVLARAAYGELRDALAGRNYVADYVQTLTHEVKSPLSAIRGAAELLQESAMPEAERQRFLANIARETERIQEMVDRMLELTTLESRRALDRLDPVALAPLLHEAAAAARATATARGVRIEVVQAQDALVEGDAFLLRRALDNLLDNALDFSPDGALVQISLEVLPRHAQIHIQDQGPGLPPYAQALVFQKFYSLARPRTGKKSTGLGLAFVKEIAALHRGRARLENAPEGGALATLVLPRAPAS